MFYFEILLTLILNLVYASLVTPQQYPSRSAGHWQGGISTAETRARFSHPIVVVNGPHLTHALFMQMISCIILIAIVDKARIIAHTI